MSSAGAILVFLLTCVALYLDGLYDFNKSDDRNLYPYHSHSAGYSGRDCPAAGDDPAQADQVG
jgi:hypothetical protein